MRRILAIILWAGIQFCSQPLWGQAPGVGIRPSGDPKQQTKLGATQTDKRGSIEVPLVVETHARPKSDKEAAEERKATDRKEFIDRWTLRLAGIGAGFTGLLVLVGGGGVWAALLTLKAIERQADLMERQATEARDSATQQMRDVQASIAEATRSSKAMEGIAESMASNVESVRKSVGISREIADMQKLATELQSRAYLSVFFDESIYQDANHVFGAQAIIRNHGNTPAYDVTFKAVAQIVPVPLPEDFEFLLPQSSAAASVSLMAPGTTKLIRRDVSSRVPDDHVDTIKRGGPPQCLAMWGEVTYMDAFRQARYT